MTESGWRYGVVGELGLRRYELRDGAGAEAGAGAEGGAWGGSREGARWVA